MRIKISTFFTAIVLFLISTSTIIAQETKAYFKKDGVVVFESAISDIDSIVFKQIDINEFNDFQNAEIVEVEYMGETVYCHYVDGYYIMEGDIIIKSDFDYIDEEDSIFSLRAAELKGNKRWTNGKVYYTMNNNSAVKASINAAISHYHSNTNLKFIRLQTNEASRYITKYLQSGKIVFKDGNENWSYLGMKDIAQELSLDITKPSAIHEIGHAIGLVHEHSRNDRDNYIIVNYDNIPNSIRHDFDTCSIATHSLSFDYGSIMMYPPKIQNAIKPNIPVITKKDGSAFTEYQRNGLSSLDKMIINNMYSTVSAEPDIMIYEQNVQPTANSCELKGELIYEGKPVTTQYGIRVIKINDDLIFYDKLGTRINNQNSCVFSCQFVDLEPNTKYRAKAYAIQKGDYVWSQNEIDFTTKQDEGDWVLINGVKWATRNVGAPGTFVANPEDYGGYYQWNKGTTDFLFNNNVYANSWLPANDPSPAGWRVPTDAEIETLFYAIVTHKWTTQNGVLGLEFTDKATGNTLFFPAAGSRRSSDGMLVNVGLNGFYWSSTPNGSTYANYLVFESGFSGRGYDSCYYGLSVRSVLK